MLFSNFESITNANYPRYYKQESLYVWADQLLIATIE